MKKTTKPWIKINIKNVLKDSTNEIIEGLKEVSLMLINKRSKK